MRKIISIYNNRSSFWSVTCSFILAILTAWMGFMVSFLIVDDNKNIQNQMIKNQYYQTFHTDVDAVLRTCFIFRNQLNSVRQQVTEIVSDLPKDKKTGQPIAQPKYYGLIDNCAKKYIKIAATFNFDDFEAHLYPLSQCVYKEYQMNLYTDIQKLEMGNNLLSTNAISAERIKSKHSNSPFAVISNAALSDSICDKIAELQSKMSNPTENNIYTVELGRLQVASDLIINPLLDIELIIRNNFIPSENTPAVSTFVKTLIILLLSLIIILAVGFAIWYILIVNVFNESINTNSTDNYHQLETTLSDLKEKYKARGVDLITYENNRMLLENQVSESEERLNIIEKRYWWILEQLKTAIQKKPNEDIRTEINRILEESKQV